MRFLLASIFASLDMVLKCPMMQKSLLKENARQPEPDLPGYIIILMKILKRIFF